ncbi:hypothetical protein [Blastococcus montanus]|uniref:hypothetical protein n=1 Tax=Blastococcus montanus TaxID=3144973 RepID=UPI0032079F24
MTKSTSINRPSTASLQGTVHYIGHFSAALGGELLLRAENALRCRFGEDTDRRVRFQFGEPPFYSFEEAVLTYGRLFDRALIPDGRRLGPQKQCYRNALTAAFRSVGRDNPLTYCEGFAMPFALGIVVEHAWLVDRDGRVIDPTWDDADSCGYVGVPLTLEHMAASQRRKNFYGHLGVPYQRLYESGLPATALAQVTLASDLLAMEDQD